MNTLFLVGLLGLWAGAVPGDEDRRTPTGVLREPLLDLGRDPAVDPLADHARSLKLDITEVELSLEQYVQLVIVRNLSLKIAELDADNTATGIQRARGAFDPELFASITGGMNKTPQASVFAANERQTLDGNVGLRGLLRTGANYGLTFATNYDRQSQTNPFFSFNPSLSSSLSLNLTQPLLRGAGPTVTGAGVEQARLLVQRGDLTLMNQVQLTAFSAVLAYWNLVFERRTYETAKTAQEVAQELVTNTQSRLDAGVMTDLDLKRAQSEERRRQEELIRAQNRMVDAEDTLIALASPGEDLASWNLDIITTTAPTDIALPTPSEDLVVQTALQTRHDLRSLETDLGLADLDLAVAENNLLPQFDFRGNYALSGLSGQTTQNGVTSGPSTNEGLFTDSLSPIGEALFKRWSLGGDFSYPLGNNSSKAGVQSARIGKERALLVLAQQRMLIIREARSALRDVKDAWARYEAASEGRSLAAAEYEAEQIRMANQVATSFEVREAQRDRFIAEDTESRAILDYEIQRARLLQVQGLLAQEFGVMWEAPVEDFGALRD